MCQPDSHDVPTDDAQSPLRCYKLIIAYDGSEFYGWQRQSSARTVQATLEEAICAITGEPVVHLLGSSRTDTGVHAQGQCATFRSRRWKAPAASLPLAINSQLPADVVVRAASEMPIAFNPIRHARSKRYRYTIYASRINNPLMRRQAWWVKRRIDINIMREASAALLGKHDFASFQTAGSPRKSTVRTVKAIDIASVDSLEGQAVTIEIEADGFLYNMARSVAGTLVLAGLKRKSVSWVSEVLMARDRKKAGPTAPSHGLCLLEIHFPISVDEPDTCA
jgi:tRNA pseudouridine38-40 synthase